jgi:hypothetical protein
MNQDAHFSVDQLGHMLKGLDPRQFTVPTAQKFREALAQIIVDLEKDTSTKRHGH